MTATKTGLKPTLVKILKKRCQKKVIIAPSQGRVLKCHGCIAIARRHAGFSQLHGIPSNRIQRERAKGKVSPRRLPDPMRARTTCTTQDSQSIFGKVTFESFKDDQRHGSGLYFVDHAERLLSIILGSAKRNQLVRQLLYRRAQHGT
jgi:hypothetical protein